MLNLDTHILLHSLTGDLRPKERKALSSDNWSISGIVLWEIAKLSELGRIEINLEDREVSRFLHRIHTWPIDLEVCRCLSRLDIQSDPADELIAATSLAHRIPLVTRDKKLRKSKIISFAC